MTKAEAIEALLEMQPRLQELGVRSISLFGSVLHDQAGPTSDLDLIAEFDPPHTAKQYFDTLFFLEDSLGVSVDLAEPGTLHPSIREQVLSEALRVA